MSEFILYTSEDGQTRIKLRAEDGTVWLSQQEMAELFATSKQNISHHVRAILAEAEQPEATVKSYLTVQNEGSRSVKRKTLLYSLPMIIAVGLRDIYATAVDYDSQSDAAQLFFKKVQNKMLWAVTGQTAAELIAARADASARF